MTNTASPKAVDWQRTVDLKSHPLRAALTLYEDGSWSAVVTGRGVKQSVTGAFDVVYDVRRGYVVADGGETTRMELERRMLRSIAESLDGRTSADGA